MFLLDNKIGEITLNKYLASLTEVIETPCPSARVRCTPVASRINTFSEIASPVSNYASPVNK